MSKRWADQVQLLQCYFKPFFNRWWMCSSINWNSSRTWFKYFCMLLIFLYIKLTLLYTDYSHGIIPQQSTGTHFLTISMLWLAQKSFWGKFGILTVRKLVHSLLQWYCWCVCPSLWSPRLQINTKRDWIKSWHASKNSLNLKPSKHCFLREGVTYIGCQLLAIGVFSHIDKIVTAQDWQVPNHVKASFQHELKTNKHLDVPFADRWNTVCQSTLWQCRVTPVNLKSTAEFSVSSGDRQNSLSSRPWCAGYREASIKVPFTLKHLNFSKVQVCAIVCFKLKLG